MDVRAECPRGSNGASPWRGAKPRVVSTAAIWHRAQDRQRCECRAVRSSTSSRRRRLGRCRCRFACSSFRSVRPPSSRPTRSASPPRVRARTHRVAPTGDVTFVWRRRVPRGRSRTVTSTELHDATVTASAGAVATVNALSGTASRRPVSCAQTFTFTPRARPTRTTMRTKLNALVADGLRSRFARTTNGWAIFSP